MTALGCHCFHAEAPVMIATGVAFSFSFSFLSIQHGRPAHVHYMQNTACLLTCVYSPHPVEHAVQSSLVGCAGRYPLHCFLFGSRAALYAPDSDACMSSCSDQIQTRFDIIPSFFTHVFLPHSQVRIAEVIRHPLGHWA